MNIRYACLRCGGQRLKEKEDTPESVTIYKCPNCEKEYTKDHIPKFYAYEERE